MKIMTPNRAVLSRLRAKNVAGALVAASIIAPLPADARPLDADTCARLKIERDALETAGMRSALNEQPPSRPAKALDERSQKLFKLIQIDAQLRFRCGLDLPIASLKPELLVDVPDTVDGEAVVKPVVRQAPVKKAKAAPATTDQATSPDTAVPAPKRTKAAASKVEKPADKATDAADPAANGVPVAKARPKPKAKVDDAFRPATKSEGGDPQ